MARDINKNKKVIRNIANEVKRNIFSNSKKPDMWDKLRAKWRKG